MLRKQMRKPLKNTYDDYPWVSICIALALLYLSPFVSTYPVYAALACCVYRVIVYDMKVFATDYALLMTVITLFRSSGGMSLLVVLCLFASVWFFLRDEVKNGAFFACLLLLLNYLLLRMQWQISNFILCFGQLFMLCVLLPQQDGNCAVRTIKMFCYGLILSSVYALVLRNVWQIRALRGPESLAFWGASIYRFQGLFNDPNYFTSMLICAMALLVKLKFSSHIATAAFIPSMIALTFFGILTYSKTFLFALFLLIVFGIIWLFRSGHYLPAIIVTAVLVLLAFYLLTGSSIFSVIFVRLSSVTNLDDLTTGRSVVFGQYMQEITDDIPSFLFGEGMAAPGLQKDPHNLYLEIAYYLGFVGLGLMIAFMVSLVLAMRKKTVRKQSFFSKYLVLIMIAVLHLALHGLFSSISYALFFLAMLSMLVEETESA